MIRTTLLRAARATRFAAPLAAILLPQALLGQTAPTPTMQAIGACSAELRFTWDVSSVAGADGANWEIRRGPAGSDVESAEVVVTQRGRPIADTIDRDLRRFAPVLDGSRWFFRVVGASGRNPVGDWSEPVIYETAASTDGMFDAAASGDAALDVSWSLAGEIGACADRIRYEVRKDAAGGSPVRSETVTGTSGSRTVDLTGLGGGTYLTRVLAFYQSDAPEAAVGSAGADVPVPFTVQEYAVRVFVTDADAAACLGADAPLSGLTVRLTRGALALEETTNDAGRARFDVPDGAYDVAVSGGACPPTTASVTVSGDGQRVDLPLQGCTTPTDYKASISAPAPTSATEPYRLSGGIRNLGPGTAAAVSGVAIDRRDAATGAVTRIATVGGALACEGTSIDGEDADFEPGKSYVYAVLLLGSDLDGSNDRAERSVSFPVEAVAATPADPDPGPAPTAPVSSPRIGTPATRPTIGRPVPARRRPAVGGSVTLSAFALQNGAATARVNEDVSLDARSSGSPREYRAALCDDFAQAPWRPYARTPAPTIRFASAGDVEVCFQLRDGASLSAVLRDGIRVLSVDAVSVGVVARRAIQPNVVVVGFRLRDGRRYALRNTPVPLDASGQNDPAYYRVAERRSGCAQDLESRGWRPWTAGSPPTTTFSSTGRKTVCFQLAREDGSGRSAPAEDSIDVVDASAQSDWIGDEKILLIPGAPAPVPRFPRALGCPTGTRAIGLVIRYEAYVNGMALRCADLGAGGVHGATSNTDFVGNGSGTRRELVCPNGRAMVGVGTRHGLVIDAIRIRCAPWTARDGVVGAASWTGYVGGTGGTATESWTCPGPMSASSSTLLEEELLGGVRIGALKLGCVVPTDL